MFTGIFPVHQPLTSQVNWPNESVTVLKFAGARSKHQSAHSVRIFADVDLGKVRQTQVASEEEEEAGKAVQLAPFFLDQFLLLQLC